MLKTVPVHVWLYALYIAHSQTTCQWAPGLCTGVSGGSLPPSHTAARGCRCFQGCNRPEPPSPGPSAAWTAAKFSYRKEKNSNKNTISDFKSSCFMHQNYFFIFICVAVNSFLLLKLQHFTFPPLDVRLSSFLTCSTQWLCWTGPGISGHCPGYCRLAVLPLCPQTLWLWIISERQSRKVNRINSLLILAAEWQKMLTSHVSFPYFDLFIYFLTPCTSKGIYNFKLHALLDTRSHEKMWCCSSGVSNQLLWFFRRSPAWHTDRFVMGNRGETGFSLEEASGLQ